MSKSSGVGNSSSTEQSGRIRSGSPVRSLSGSRVSNYQDIVTLPKVTFVDEMDGSDYNTNKDLKSLKADFSWDNLDNREIVSMFGGLNGSKVAIRRDTPSAENGEEHRYTIKIMNDFLNEPQERKLVKYSDGRVVISNEAFYLKQIFNPETKEVDIDPRFKEKGIGTKSLSRQVYYATKNGVSYLRTYAFRDDAGGSFGHIVWPKLGFDRLLSPSEAAFARKALKDPMIRTVLDVLDRPNGDLHWFEYGSSGVMVFNLTKGSRSFRKIATASKKKLSQQYGRLW